MLGANLTGPLYTTFDGEAVGVNDVLVKYTWFGDADLNGQVNSNDYFQIDTGFLTGLSGWLNGDFDYDGAITSNDYFLIDRSFLGQGSPILSAPPPTSTTSQAVPEPASVSTAAVIATIFSFARLRRRRPSGVRT